MLAELRAAGLRFTAEGGKLYVEPASALTDAQRATIRAHKTALLRELAGEANDPHGGGVAPLSVVQEGARRQVLAQLKANPSVQRAFVNRFEHGAMIVTLAVRGVGACELSISAERFNAASMDDYAALLACLTSEKRHCAS